MVVKAVEGVNAVEASSAFKASKDSNAFKPFKAFFKAPSGMICDKVFLFLPTYRKVL